MAGTAIPGRLGWQLTRVVAKHVETPRVMTLRLESDAWPGHLPGQHVDVRLTAEDGYQAQRSYSIASAPAAGSLDLTVEKIADGEVSPYLSEELRPGDRLELRGPIGGYFTWKEAAPAPRRRRLRRGAPDVDAPLPGSHWERHPGHPALLVTLVGRDHLPRGARPAQRWSGAARHPHSDPIAPDGWNGYTRRIDAAMLEDARGEQEPDDSRTSAVRLSSSKMWRTIWSCWGIRPIGSRPSVSARLEAEDGRIRQ